MRTWHGVIMIEGVQTGDGRFFEAGSIQWRDLPLALVDDHPTMATSHAAIGNVTTIERVGNEIRATGTIDDTTPTGGERVRMMDEGTAPMGNRWPVSIEFHDAEVQIIDTTIEDNPDNATPPAVAEEALVITASTNVGVLVATGRKIVAGLRALRAASGDGEPQGVVLFEAAQDDIIEKYTNARVHNVATVTAGAIEGAFIELDAVSADTPPADTPPAEGAGLLDEIINAEVVDLTGENAIVASAKVPTAPPVAWFDVPEPADDDPRLAPQYDIETGDYIGLAMPLEITDDGQVMFHLAPRDRCHIGYSGLCVTPPESASAYAHFHLGYVQTAEGDRVATGPLTCGCDHASTLGLDADSARDWYANNGLAWADVRVTPGRLGPWACGALRPGVSEELVRALRGGGVSGDWRGVGANGLELVAVLAVNTPGFTVQRALAASAGPTRIMRAHSFVSVSSEHASLLTRPVVRTEMSTDEHGHTCSKCGAGPSEELRLLRVIASQTRALNPQRAEQLRARLRG